MSAVWSPNELTGDLWRGGGEEPGHRGDGRRDRTLSAREGRDCWGTGNKAINGNT